MRFVGLWASGKETTSATVDMIDLNYETLDMLVSFIYTHQLKFSKWCTFRSAILAADFLMMDGALEALSDMAIKGYNLDICDYYPVADRLSRDAFLKVTENIRRSLYNNDPGIFRDVMDMQFEDFLNVVKCHERTILELIPPRNLQVIKQWLELDLDKRVKHSFALLSSIVFRSEVPVGFRHNLNRTGFRHFTLVGGERLMSSFTCS